ncbi:MAG TPA: butyrate kinase, partial [Longimicrobiales bacterium]|nr:butyrate kinase [Longimicrobiales bacterium]
MMRILAVNPGATSTKVGVYEEGEAVLTVTVPHGDQELAAFRGRPVLEQLEMRVSAVIRALDGELAASFDAVVGRGGLLRP